MTDHTHLLLMQMHERELNERIRHRRHGLTQHRTPLRSLTARTLHRLADRLDASHARRQPAHTSR
ncbi:hypothetical protein FE697_001060 [Mumia zhuanghuii]|uniref:Uncharacterized protein n=2 Tax=Mumia TaxID=1546255 RepID=A0ABW1QH72_9ACTN|nr:MULTISPECIES: hypothetical protein [Mumia]KAA1424551.1 hypothetical protein FE697_001060 [Mumia zhuanghuii]